MSVTPSPAVGRIARILHAIADSPEGALTLAELSRRSGVSKPTAHSLLLAMTADGLVDRSGATPTYALGPTLVELGARARREPSLAALADEELGRLERAIGVSCIAATVAGDEIVVLAARCVPHPFGYQVVPGSRLPFAAPVGPVYVAWAGDALVDRWLDAASPALSDARRRAVRRDLAAIRQRGWSATRRDARTGTTGREVAGRDLDGGPLDVLGVSAPLRDRTGAVVGSLAVVGLGDGVSGEQLRGLAAEIVAAATRVSRRLGAP